MFWWSTPPRPGDEVTLTRPVYTSLFTTPIPAGTRAIVLDPADTGTGSGTGTSIEVETAGGLWQGQRVKVRLRDCAVTRRGVGTEKFRSRNNTFAAVRLGAGLVIVGPLVWFVVSYYLSVGSFDGFWEYLPVAVLDAAGLALIAAWTNPVATVLSAAVGWGIWKLAVGNTSTNTGRSRSGHPRK